MFDACPGGHNVSFPVLQNCLKQKLQCIKGFYDCGEKGQSHDFRLKF